ncbi:hypothetical protein [Natrinema salsiterrestre]|uniref:Uncharacterized protein n=1 Tax=Natrinema salsiterrestre TaxID=2950540 RepID=A0A9Q4L3R9_9EURY|nr:hypothetical protein [Natrinema salsiterrestre]MDF9744791.1 hypothetical protein [Natrinema salsiterrestre]
MSSSDDGGYVHDPSAFDADSGGERGDEEPADGSEGGGPAHPATVDREFDWRGWILVGVLFFAFIVAPIAIYLVPPGAEGYRFALLILPLAPALLLAITAVWATTRP